MNDESPANWLEYIGGVLVAFGCIITGWFGLIWSTLVLTYLITGKPHIYRPSSLTQALIQYPALDIGVLITSVGWLLWWKGWLTKWTSDFIGSKTQPTSGSATTTGCCASCQRRTTDCGGTES